MMVLSECQVGTRSRIQSLGMVDSYKKRLMDLGLIPGTEVRIVRKAPLGDPIIVEVRGYQISFRLSDASGIHVEMSGA